MRTNIFAALTLLFAAFSFTNLTAQVENVQLTQITGAFETEALSLAPGDYQFEIINDGVDHEVGFVLVPKGQYDAANHIQAAYVKAPVATGTSSMTSVVALEAGDYEYFCPLNPTAKYPLTVAEAVKLTQTPGKFETESLELTAGTYQFEVINDGVDHEVGFVLVPKGQYDAVNHIQAAYVKAPVANGTSSMTSVVALEAGDYEYFCPLNPTAKYPLTVAEAVKLTQTPGKFETEGLKLAAGNYQFEIINDGVDHEVGFVLVPKGQYDAANHIQAAYVKAPVANGTSSMTSVVALEAGDYEYFCPLNPTAKYPLTVAKTVKLSQTPGKFATEGLKLTAGTYQFEIANDGVDHEVGFVLVPKGQYDAANHIQAAYVKAPVANGTSSMTSVVTLEAGQYEYFCPLNPTAKYPLTVK